MMETDNAPAVEGDGTLRVLGLPQGNHDRAVTDEHRRVVGHFPDLLEAEPVDEEISGLPEPGHSQA
jgi:hypothetical protein